MGALAIAMSPALGQGVAVNEGFEWFTVRYGGRRCHCGNVGCAEAEASTAFLSDVAAGLPEWERSSLRGLATLNYEEVFRHAAHNDACAVRLRDQSLRVWSTLAVNLVHAYDPEVVILGGGIMASADVILPAVRTHLDRHAHTPWGRVRVVGCGAALVHEPGMLVYADLARWEAQLRFRRNESSNLGVQNRTPKNYGWCFACVPEENSLLLELGPHRVELASLDLVFAQ